MGIGERGDERDLLIRNGHPGGTELPDDATHVDGVPHQDGVAQETQTARLVHNLFIVSRLKRPLIGKKEAASQLMPKLAPVELALDTMAQVRILDIAEDYVEFILSRETEELVCFKPRLRREPEMYMLFWSLISQYVPS